MYWRPGYDPVGHELRNPLAPIFTALELIKLRTSGELSREYRIIERQAAHLSRPVDDLLDVTRIVRGKVELRKSLVNLSTALTHAVENVAPLMKERGDSFTIQAPNRAVWVLLIIVVVSVSRRWIYCPSDRSLLVSACKRVVGPNTS